MFLTIFRFEIAYQLRRPSTWLYFGLLSVAGGALPSMGVQVGHVMLNSPFLIGQYMGVVTELAQIVTAAFIGLAVLRDFNMQAHELFFTTRITKTGYLGGRLAGALVVMALMFTALPLGAMAGTLMPWVDRTALQPFHLWHYVSPYLVIVLPTLVIVGLLFFAIGILTRSQLAVYTLGFLLLMADSIANQLRNDVESARFTALTDAFGTASAGLVTRYWTTIEKNTLTIPLAGPFLLSRLFFLGIALVLVAVAWAAFRFDALPRSLWRKRVAVVAEPEVPAERPALAMPAAHRRPGHGHWWREIVETARFSFQWIVRSIPFLSILTIAMVGVVHAAWNADTLWKVGKVYPLTVLMFESSQNVLDIFLLVLVTLYAGELVWHERQIKADELVDSLPVASPPVMIGRVLGLLAAVAALFAAAIVTDMVVQTLKGYTHYEIARYLEFSFLTEFPRIVALVLFAFFVHTVVNNKYIGHLLMIGLVLAVLKLDSIGWEHRLYQLGRTPYWTYSDMNGFGPYIPKLVWYAAYWSAFTAFLFVVAVLFWVRGTDAGRRARLALARARLTRRLAVAGSTCAALTLLLGGGIYYNSNVLEHYHPSGSDLDLQARYERTFKRFRDLPQPTLADVSFHVDLVPERLAYALAARFTFVNATARPIDTLMVDLVPDHSPLQPVNIGSLDSLHFDRPVTLLPVSDTMLGTYLYALARPLAPGDTITLGLGSHHVARGFANGEANTEIAYNGSVLSPDLLPQLGYQREFEISDPDERRKRGLPGIGSRLPPLADSLKVPHVPDTWGSRDVVVSTAPDQIAVVPGYREREWMQNGRHFFHYVSETPGDLGFTSLSARYAVRRDTWTGPHGGRPVAIEIYHHPTHTYAVDRMLRSVKRSLDYYTTNFGPYQYRQLRILEYPRYDNIAFAMPNTIPYSEGAGFISRAGTSEDDVDNPFLVTAHEVAHQWWGHQSWPAPLEGGRMLVESLAQYCELMVLRKEFGLLPTRRQLGYMMDAYLNGRSFERNAEQPIVRNQQQDYLVYPKGGLVMYALADYIGEDRVNAALRNFLARHHRPDGAPNTMDLVREFRAVTPDSLQSVITDLFETITLFENRADSATSTKRADGKYVVRLSLSSRKLRADSLGAEHEIPVNDWIDVGVFGAPAKGAPHGKQLYLAKHHFTPGAKTIEVVVDELPLTAGIDPYHILIDRNTTDNVTQVRAP